MSLRNIDSVMRNTNALFPAIGIARHDLRTHSRDWDLTFPQTTRAMQATRDLFRHEFQIMRDLYPRENVASLNPLEPPVDHTIIGQLRTAMDRAAADQRWGGTAPEPLTRAELEYGMSVTNLILTREQTDEWGLPVWMTTEQRRGRIDYIGDTRADVSFDRTRPSTWSLPIEFLTRYTGDPE